MNEPEKLIPLHGGYRKLKSFQVAQLAYDVTVRFCDRYVEKRSRTHDQMVQAARSGVQNIAEGSQASGTSKKTELKLPNVARSSLEELRLDYEGFLRQRGLALWPREDPRRAELIARRPAAAEDVAAWARDAHNGQHGPRGQSGQEPVRKSMQSARPTVSPYPEIAANGALALIAVACSLLSRQLAAQEKLLKKRAASPKDSSACAAKTEAADNPCPPRPRLASPSTRCSKTRAGVSCRTRNTAANKISIHHDAYENVPSVPPHGGARCCLCPRANRYLRFN
jgi:four helix bundle protein